MNLDTVHSFRRTCVSVVALAGGVLMINACSSVDVNPQGGAAEFPEGSAVVVNEDLPIYPDWSRAFIQLGKVVHSDDIQWFEDSCNFESTELSKEGNELAIKAGRFQTGRVTHIRPGDGTGGGLRRRGFSGSVQVAISSDEQPHVRALICGYRADAEYGRRFVSLMRMREIVGDLVTFEIAEAAE